MRSADYYIANSAALCMETARESTPTSGNLRHQKDVWTLHYQAWVVSSATSIEQMWKCMWINSNVACNTVRSTILTTRLWPPSRITITSSRRTILPISSQSHRIRVHTDGFETAKKEHGFISTWTWELRIATGHHQVLFYGRSDSLPRSTWALQIRNSPLPRNVRCRM